MMIQTAQNRNLKRKPNPLFIFAIIVAVLLLALSVLSASLLAKQNAVADANKTLDPNNLVPEAQSPSQSENELYSPTFLKLDGVDYILADEHSGLSVTEKNGIFSIVTENGIEYSFCEGLCDYFCGETLGNLPHPAQVKDGKLCLPLSNLTKENADKDEILAAAIPVVSEKDAPRLPQNTTCEHYFNAVTKSPEFQCDLSEYEQYMEPLERDGFLVLANADHSLGKDFVPQNLVAVERARYAEDIYKAKLQKPAAMALDAFLKEAYAEGYSDVTVTSGYRSYADQENRFNTKVSSLRSSYATLEEAQAAAATVIQWPGKSEHQTGLACDMHNLAAADVSFKDQPAATWLKENAHYFGFILRYPEDKTDITGISFEPWHFRYVGRYHATRMFLLNLTLEEYTAFISLSQEAA